MTPKTVAIGAVLALAGVLLGMNFPIAEAQRVDGPYALTGGGAPAVVWRMNTQTGEVSLCGVAGPTPSCSPWGPTTER